MGTETNKTTPAMSSDHKPGQTPAHGTPQQAQKAAEKPAQMGDSAVVEADKPVTGDKK